MKPISFEKEFNTRELIGKRVWITTKKTGLEICGTLKEYFERNSSVVLEDYAMWQINEDGTKDNIENGELIIIKGDAWIEIKVKK